jgi:putative peptidoglycan lipid II flippase
MAAVSDSPPPGPSASERPAGAFRGLRVVSGMILLSRITGLIRDSAMAGLFGAGPVMDAFTVAFRIPNLARRLFGEGALTTSFLPIFVRELKQSDRVLVWKLATSVLTTLTLFLSALVLLGEFGLWATGMYGDCSSETLLLLELTAIMLPYLVLICVAAQVSAILNGLGHFTWPACIPLVLNLTWIAGIWGAAVMFDSAEARVRAIAIGVLVAGIFQLAVQLPPLWKYGFRFQGDWREARPLLREVVFTMAPVIVGLSITQINTLADSLIAWFFSAPADTPDALISWLGGVTYPLRAGTVSALYFGERMYQFPLGVFGVALGTVLFPLLARHAAAGEFDRLRDDLSLGLRMVLVIGMPASVAYIFLAHPIARAFFERGAFGPEETTRAAGVIASYGSGVWAYIAVLILHRGFYATGDRMAPLRIGLMMVALNFVLNVSLIWLFGELALPCNTSACAMLQAATLAATLQWRVGAMNWRQIGWTALRTAVCCVVMAAAGLGVLYLQTMYPVIGGKYLELLAPAVIAGGVYLVAARVLQLEEFWMLLRRERGSEGEGPMEIPMG